MFVLGIICRRGRFTTHTHTHTHTGLEAIMRTNICTFIDSVGGLIFRKPYQTSDYWMQGVLLCLKGSKLEHVCVILSIHDETGSTQS